jgi:hypothetical protein
MPAYAEGGVSAHLIAAATDNNRQRLRTRRAKLSRNQPVLALVFASAAARARAQDASTSHADAGGYPSGEPLAKAPRAFGVHAPS